jgi:hypothetical protein
MKRKNTESQAIKSENHGIAGEKRREINTKFSENNRFVGQLIDFFEE